MAFLGFESFSQTALRRSIEIERRKLLAALKRSEESAEPG
jgi:hypothetical protein